MADEITVSAALCFDDSESDKISLGVLDGLFDVTTKVYVRNKIAVGTSERAIPLGDVADPGWAFFKNVSTSGVISIRLATAMGAFAELQPGEFACLRLGSAASAPYAIASAAGTKLEYFIVDS